MRLRLVRHPARADGSYEGASGTWRPGDVREVDEAEAHVLLADFPGAFEVVVEVLTGQLREDLAEPPQDRMIRQPPVRGRRGGTR